MRILRGQSNLEVSSQGLALFVLGLIIATFLGGALRTVLNSDSIQKRLLAEAARRWPDASLEVGSMEILLSNNWWPGIVFEIKDLNLVIRSCRSNSSRITMDHLRAPIRLMSLWRGNPQLGSVEGGSAKVNFYAQPCAKERQDEVQNASHEAVAANSSEPSVTKLAKIDWTPARKVLTGVSLRQLEITSEGEPTLKTILRDLSLSVEDELTGQGEVEIQKVLPLGAFSYRVNVSLTADEEIANLKLRGKFKEGLIHWGVQVNLADNTFTQQIDLRQIPVKDIFSELYRLGVLQKDVILKSFWLSCQLNQTGDLAKWQAQTVNVRNCKMEGGQGRVLLEEAKLSFAGDQFLQSPLLLRVNQMEILPVLEALRRDPLTRVFSKLGNWSGEVTFNAANDWRLQGQLQGLEVIFSNQSVRGKQVVKSMATTAAATKGQVQAKIFNVDLQDGKMEGEISLMLDEKMRSGDLSLNLQNFLLSQHIQKILFDGSLENLKLVGQGQLNEGNVVSWRGQLASEGISGDGWAVKSIQAQTEFKSERFTVKATAKDLQMDSSWESFPMFKVMYGDSKKFNWHQLEGQAEIQREGGQINRFTALDANSPQRIFAQGSWRRDREFTGTLQLQGARGSRKFSLLGRQGRLLIRD